MGIWSKMWETQKATTQFMARSVAFEYLGGHPKLRGKEIRIGKGEAENEILVNLNKLPMTLISYQWGEQATRSVGKAAAGAIVGGVLTGGVGAIVGGAIGAKKKDKSTLTLTVEDDGKQYQILVRCDEAKFWEFTNKVIS